MNFQIITWTEDSAGQKKPTPNSSLAPLYLRSNAHMLYSALAKKNECQAPKTLTPMQNDSKAMKNLIVPLLIIVLGFVNCTNYKKLNNEDIKRAFIENSSATFRGYFYKGSDKDYHYFVSKWDYSRDRYFKIDLLKLKVIKPIDFNNEMVEVGIGLSSSNEVFAENEFYKLHFIRNR